MTSFLVLLLVMAQIYKASNLPNHLKISSKDVTPVTPLIIEHPQPNAIPETKTRKKKGPTIPLSLQFQHQYLVPNLHVIPLGNVQHNRHDGNLTHTNLIQVLIPIHNLVPVHDLTVIPLHRVSEQKISYRLNDEQDDDRYRNPLGGYGVGWRFGGHGAGHGFHYSYG
ncbi:uncharacterized protein LOC125068839 isoform X1 [Vanessa atalanta]|uniref:uncharacterized protein LOC125068839 isoform X1 n=1 Tax=Vanessa atalanta TaxID=42275 RepID=UPI001FCD2F98|nr:uncharacterized protein LOC125068839 isoform X1 [Vanessa atalanta]